MVSVASLEADANWQLTKLLARAISMVAAVVGTIMRRFHFALCSNVKLRQQITRRRENANPTWDSAPSNLEEGVSPSRRVIKLKLRQLVLTLPTAKNVIG